VPEDVVGWAPERAAPSPAEHVSIHPRVCPPLAAQGNALARDEVDERTLNRFTGRLDDTSEGFAGNYFTAKAQCFVEPPPK